MTQDEIMKEWKRIIGDAYLVQDRRTFLQILADWHIQQVEKIIEPAIKFKEDNTHTYIAVIDEIIERSKVIHKGEK